MTRLPKGLTFYVPRCAVRSKRAALGVPTAWWRWPFAGVAAPPGERQLATFLCAVTLGALSEAHGAINLHRLCGPCFAVLQTTPSDQVRAIGVLAAGLNRALSGSSPRLSVYAGPRNLLTGESYWLKKSLVVITP